MDDQRIRDLLDRAETSIREARAVLNSDKARAGGRMATIQNQLRDAHASLSRAIDEAGA